MAKTAKRQATCADIEALPDDLTGDILLRLPAANARPAHSHEAAAGALGIALDTPARVRTSASADKAYGEQAPDLVSEILSPGPQKHAKGNKWRIYALYGVDHLWHLDPQAREPEVLQRQEIDWRLAHAFVGTEDFSAPPFDAITFPLGLMRPFDLPADQSAT